MPYTKKQLPMLHMCEAIYALSRLENAVSYPNSKITFNGQRLSPEDAARTLAMFYLLFPHYQNPKS